MFFKIVIVVADLVGTKWCVILALICVSLMTDAPSIFPVLVGHTGIFGKVRQVWQISRDGAVVRAEGPGLCSCVTAGCGGNSLEPGDSKGCVQGPSQS